MLSGGADDLDVGRPERGGGLEVLVVAGAVVAQVGGSDVSGVEEQRSDPRGVEGRRTRLKTRGRLN